MACERESRPEIKYCNLYGDEKGQTVFILRPNILLYRHGECSVYTPLYYYIYLPTRIIVVCNVYDNTVKYNNITRYMYDIIIYALLGKISFSVFTVITHAADWECT